MSMKHWIKIDEECRLTSYADEGFHCGEGEILAEIPEGFEPNEIRDYRYVDGRVVHDPLPPAEEDDAPSMEERMAELEAQNTMLMECLLEMSEIVYA